MVEMRRGDEARASIQMRVNNLINAFITMEKPPAFADGF
jgi:hypothetical protein